MTRRTLLQSASAALAGRVIASATPLAAAETAATDRRLTTGWEFHHGTLGGIWEAWRGKAAASDDAPWEKVTVPHCFNAFDAVDPEHAYYEGPGWYRTAVAWNNPFAGGRTLLNFEGTGQRSAIYIGLEKVAEHVGGYDGFTVDITDAASRAVKRPEAAGKLEIAVMCDNSRDLEMIPSDQSDFNRYGGLYRPVELVYVPAVSLERVHVESNVVGGKASASVRARLHNPAAAAGQATVEVRVTDPSGKVVHTSSKSLPPWSGEQEIASFTVDSPALWSTTTPNLYRCSVTLKTAAGEHAVAERFGFRSWSFPKHGVFSLNGERLFLRGTQRHEDQAGTAAAEPEDAVRREMEMVRQMGCNFIRLGHYQQTKQVLELCDELGLIVWEEIPWCRGGVGNEQYKEQGRRMLRNMIDQHRNHPSVVFWGLGNETDWPGDFPTFDKDAIRAYMTELNQIAHKLDPSRLTAIRRNEFARDIPDVYSPSIWAGWYSGRYTEYKGAIEKAIPQVDRMLHIEWGGDSHARRHSEDPDRVIAKIATGQGVEEKDRAFLLTGGQTRASRDGDWSETYICNLFDWYLKEQETMPALAGSAMWVFKDFSTPLRPENPVPRVNQKGVLERDLTPKEGYYVFQSYWAEKPMAHIYGHSWPLRWGDAGESKMVKVYSNCSTAELFHNGKSCGVKKRDSQDFPAAGLRWQVPFTSGENHLRVVAAKGGAQVTDEIAFHYQTEKWGKPAKFVWREVGRQQGAITYEVRLLDASGVQCLDSRARLEFAHAGDGSLVENMGTGTGSRVMEMYNGRALTTVLLEKGEALLSVSTPGVPTAFQTAK